MKYPSKLNNIIDFYKTLPGIGEKNALRMAISTYEMKEDRLKEFSSSLNSIKVDIKKCAICGCICDEDICDVCKDPNRNKNLICVLEDYKSVFSFDKSNVYDGTYHVLGGLISPMDGINPEDLNLKSLVDRVKNLVNPEVIIALTSSIEGDMTMLYLSNLLKEYKVKVTRLSHGVPLGLSLDYMDMLSLNRALEDRREIND